jgi:hypothetical protein
MHLSFIGILSFLYDTEKVCFVTNEIFYSRSFKLLSRIIFSYSADEERNNSYSCGGRIKNLSNPAKSRNSIYFFDISKVFFETKNKKFRIMH